MGTKNYFIQDENLDWHWTDSYRESANLSERHPSSEDELERYLEFEDRDPLWFLHSPDEDNHFVRLGDYWTPPRREALN